MFNKSYAAAVAVGFVFQADLRALSQVQLSKGMCNFDPCVKEPIPARCEVDVSYVGVAVCICPDGFIGDGKPIPNGGTGCQNEDECTTGNNDCDLKTQICVDKNPAFDDAPFECVCKNGFTPSASGKSCHDVDECGSDYLNLCDPETTSCRNLPGSYECMCKDPKSLFDSATASCIKLNPCEDNEGRDNPCDEESTFCLNREGTAQCACRPGYQNHPDNPRACIDIDECGLQLDQCDTTISRCQNEIGDYRCLCKESMGWTTSKVNNKLCENLNECERWPLICGDAAPCCADLHPEMGGFHCAPTAEQSGVQGSNAPGSLPDPTAVLPASYSSKALEALIAQAVLEQQMAAGAAAGATGAGPATAGTGSVPAAIAPQSAPLGPMGRPLVYPTEPASSGRLIGHVLRRSTLDSDTLHGVTERKLQSLLSRLVGNVHSAPLPGIDVMRTTESAVCPIGYRHKEEIAKAKARAKTAEALKKTFAGSHRARPDQVANGIVTNAGVIANEFANWYHSIAGLPNQVAYASQNATNINPAGDAMNAMKSGEQLMQPFLPGGARMGGAVVGSPATVGMPGVLGAYTPSVAGTAGKAAATGVASGVIAGGVTAALLKNGPGDSWAMDRSGLSKYKAYGVI